MKNKGEVKFENYKIYYLGNIDLLESTNKIAVVGSRQMSEYGKVVIEKLIPEMVKKDIVIVSGMAFGVDAWAHNICVNNKGKTIAVLASGPDMVTPKGNGWIYKKILDNNGLVLSMKNFGNVIESKQSFLERNRIVALMSNAVVVIEGGQRSGSINTARLAIEMGKEVGAVPGRITDENSKATNWLLKNGAALVENCDDVWDLLQ